MNALVDLGAEIYGYEGPRSLLTLITATEQDPMVMGFSLLGDEPALYSDENRPQGADIDIAPEDAVVGVEIEGD